MKPILQVEDDPNDVFLLQHAMKRVGVTNPVQIARDGQEAIDYLQGAGKFADRDKFPLPCLVLLDLKLPKVDGLEILREIKSDERTKAIPVIVMTSSKEQRDWVESHELGVDSFVTKPVDFDSFSKAVSKLGCYWVLLNHPPAQPVRNG